MNNFTYYNPTKIVFGKGTIAELKNLVPIGEKVLLVYGGGSIKHNGVYDQVISALAGWIIIEFGGIEPNPAYETLMKAVEVVRQEHITFILAVGGGSVGDGAKFIAAAAGFTGTDPWESLIVKQEKITSALPMGIVLTLPATGTESNQNAVISRRSTREKISFYSPFMIPRFAILDPETTYSLPIRQVRNGVVDAFIHVTEQYLTYPVNAPLQDRQAEGILLTLIEEGPKTLANPTDYEARANLVWCATQALNSLIGCGVPPDWGTHRTGHELTAFYGVDHAESLAIVLPSLLRHQRKGKEEKLLQYARRVWGIEEKNVETACELAIQKTEAFFQQLGMPTRFKDYHIPADEAARRIQERFTQRGTLLGERKDITPERAAAILRDCA